ncbi:bifunctional metallophosphatase/5'-nucleotidase [Pseudomonadota bacterium]
MSPKPAIFRPATLAALLCATSSVFVVADTFLRNVFAAEVEEIRIIGTNDLHMYLRPVYYRYLDEIKPWGPQPRDGDYLAKTAYEGKVGGMAHVATVIKRLRAETPNKNLVIDAGDTWHGAGLSLFDRGISMVKIMNTIGYDVMVPGNWEYFYPKEHFLKLVEQANFPVIAYNLTDKEWEDPVLEPYIIKTVGMLKVAIVGVTYPWTALTSSITGAAKWWKFGIKENEANELVKSIKQKENPDLIVFASHGGFGLDQKFAQRVNGIDVLGSGHTHDEIFDPVVWNNTIIFQAGAHGKYVASLDLKVRDKKVINFAYRLVKVTQDRIPADPDVKKLVNEAYRPYQDKLDEVIGHSNVLLYRRDYFQSPFGNLMSDALRKLENTDIAFFPAWRYGATILPGKITAEDVYNVIPTQGKIHTYTMQGKNLTTLLENILSGVTDKDPYTRVGGDMIRFSGMKLRYDLNKNSGERIVSLMVGDQPVQSEKNYTIASVHTRFQTSPLFGATNVKTTDKVFVEELIKYIKNHSPITTQLDDRIQSITSYEKIAN